MQIHLFNILLLLEQTYPDKRETGSQGFIGRILKKYFWKPPGRIARRNPKNIFGNHRNEMVRADSENKKTENAHAHFRTLYRLNSRGWLVRDRANGAMR